MNQRETMEYIEKMQEMGSVYGLDTMRELLRRLGNPEKQLKIVHIAGTNGKGSILAMFDQIFQKAGYRCGRYISPTIFCYLERFQINGAFIDEKTLAKLMTQVANEAQEMKKEGKEHPTLFELETAVAFLWFLEQQVDVVFLETGLGGRLDSTNVIEHPLCVLFASISRDHMAILGDTIEEIAREKAGIMKKGCPIISYPNEPKVENVLRQVAKEVEAPIFIVDENEIKKETYSLEGQVFSYKQYKKLTLSLLGEHQLKNAAVVLEAIEQLKPIYPIGEEAILEGFSTAVWKGRLEVLQKSPVWIRDGAHNVDAAKQLRKSLEQYFQIKPKGNEGKLLEVTNNKMQEIHDEKLKIAKNIVKNTKKMKDIEEDTSFCFTNRRVFYIIGVLADKEYEAMLQIMAPLSDVIVTMTPENNKRALSSSRLADCARKYANTVIDGKTLEKSVALVKELTTKEDIVIVFGSLSFIGELENL